MAATAAQVEDYEKVYLIPSKIVVDTVNKLN